MPPSFDSLGGHFTPRAELLAPLQLNRTFSTLLLPSIKEVARKRKLSKPNTMQRPAEKDGPQLRDDFIEQALEFIGKYLIVPDSMAALDLIDWLRVEYDISPETTAYSVDSQFGRFLGKLIQIWPHHLSEFSQVIHNRRGRRSEIVGVSFNFVAFQRVRERIRAQAYVARRIGEQLTREPTVTLELIERRLGDSLSAQDSGLEINDLSLDIMPIIAKAGERNGFSSMERHDYLPSEHPLKADSYPKAYHLRPATRVAAELGINPGDVERYRWDQGHIESLTPESLSLTSLNLSQREIAAMIRLANSGDQFLLDNLKNWGADYDLTDDLVETFVRSLFTTAINGYQKLLANPKLDTQKPNFSQAIDHFNALLDLLNPQNITYLRGRAMSNVKYDRSYYSEYIPTNENEEAKALLTKIREATSFPSECRTFLEQAMVAEYIHRFIPLGDAIAVDSAVPPSMIPRIGLERWNNNLASALISLPLDIVPISMQITPDETYTISGANGSGKSIAVDTIVTTILAADHPEYVPVANRVTLPKEVEIVRLASPRSTESQSLFQASARPLASFIAQMIGFAGFEAARSGPKKEIHFCVKTDEWGIGTDPLARTAILKATQRIVQQSLPPNIHITFINSTHEAADHAIADAALNRCTSTLRKNQLIAIDPMTRKMVPDLISPSYAALALEPVDPEMAEALLIVEELIDAGVEELDLSDVEESPIYPGNISLGCASRIDLDRLHFENNGAKGQFAFLLSTLKEYKLPPQSADKFVDAFAEAFRAKAATATEERTAATAKLRLMQQKIRELSDEKFSTALLEFTLISERLRAFSVTQFSPVDLLRIAHQLDSSNTSGNNFDAIIDILDEDSKEEFITNIATLQQISEEVRAVAINQLKQSVARQLVFDLIDWQIVKEHVRQESDFLARLSLPKDEREIAEFLIAQVLQGQLGTLLSLYELCPYQGNSSVFDFKTSRSESDETQAVTLERLQAHPLVRMLTVSTDDFSADELLSSADVRQALSEIRSWLEPEQIFSEGTSETVRKISQQVQKSVLAIGGGVLERNKLGVPWSQPDVAVGGGSFGFTDAYDLSVLTAVGRDNYIPQTFSAAASKQKDVDVHTFTGPNAEGKTSLASIAAELIIYAEVLGIVPAASADLNGIRQIAVSLNGFVAQPERGLSGLTANGADWRRIIDTVRDARSRGLRTLVLLDEIFAGTNGDSQTSLTAICFDQLKKSGALVFATSHSGSLRQRVDQINLGRGDAGMPLIGMAQHTVEEHVVKYDQRGDSLPYRILQKEMEHAGLDKPTIQKIVDLSQYVENHLRMVHGQLDAEELAERASRKVAAASRAGDGSGGVSNDDEEPSGGQKKPRKSLVRRLLGRN